MGTVLPMRSGQLRATIAVAVSAAALGGCGGGGTATSAHRTAAPRPGVVRWTGFVRADRPLDVVGPRRDGAIVLAAAGRLWLLRPDRSLRPYAPAYRSPGGEEPYIALAPTGCFGRDTVYAIRLHGGRGVIRIDVRGRVRRLAPISARGLIDGIAFDRTGAFGRRLLVTVNAGTGTTVDAVDCRGGVHTIARHAPRIEGGIAVAPAGFGRFAGDLVAPDERGGNIYAISPQGRTRLIGASRLPHGPDIGVESAGFVPAGGGRALLADRLTPGNRHPGDDLVLSIDSHALAAAGVRPGDLLIAAEGGALTDAVRCRRTACQIRHVANGPAVAHAEGHIAFLSGG
jgi:hypothetical protein